MRFHLSGGASLTVLVLVAAAGTTGFLLRPAEPPANLSPGQSADSAPSSVERFSDERSVEVDLVTGPDLDLELGRGGRVTSTECSAGASLASGEAVAEIDGEPVLALATSAPPYRDLAPGARGPDVAALQSELARLGHDTAEDGTYGEGTATAVRAFQRDGGLPRPDGRMPLAGTLWIPAAEVAVGECHAPIGTTVGPGSSFATVPGTLAEVTVTSPPTARVDGARVLTVGGVTGPFDADGRGDDPDFLRELSDTAEARAARDGEGTRAMGSLALAEPVEVLRVPPGAVSGGSEGTGCLVSEGRTHAVDIVGSTIGSALVVPAGGGDPTTLPGRVDLKGAQAGTCQGTRS
ncbi:peptidoglycan-binding domain-containing protein [Nocardiopsis metallicus]|uniref:Peptidoglycan hydrolase-like protein with peptidoglycan-binding domain n=1 Tax=Nocardiopsis metallicus TaxID=179819 RepID=A0A840WE26_9ACTN|nr:peptidoglycan-binding domain-containing protein [Nocardiopsis metallicus]MBB5489586.1 peptidoglycan hydrolase-like protein with peptidoglycan-binding domain [Nocardiopsis metallicus]